jgi:iron(III) transport system substrate-binding protein
MRTRRPMALVLTVLALAAATVTACGSDDQPGDKKLTVYSGRSETLVKPILEQFQQASGITVDVRYGDSAAMAAQILEEGDRSPADVFLSQDAGALGAVAKEGLFAVLPADVLSKVSDSYQARNGHWVGVTGRSRVLVYNADQVPEADLPASVLDLTDAKWNGKVGLAPTNASFQAFVTAMRVKYGEDRAKQFLTDLKGNGAQIRDNNVLIVNDVNDGKLAAGLVNHYYVFAKAKELGTSVDQLDAKLHFFPDGDLGALVNVSGVGVLTKAGTDPDARALVDFLLGAQAQAYFAEQTFEYPLVAGVPAADGLPQLNSLEAPDIDLNDLDTLQATVQMIKDAGLA